MSMPKWHDVYSADELASALDFTAARVARRWGAYEVADELRHAANCIRDLSERVDAAIGANVDLHQRVRAGLESLKEPR